MKATAKRRAAIAAARLEEARLLDARDKAGAPKPGETRVKELERALVVADIDARLAVVRRIIRPRKKAERGWF